MILAPEYIIPMLVAHRSHGGAEITATDLMVGLLNSPWTSDLVWCHRLADCAELG